MPNEQLDLQNEIDSLNEALCIQQNRNDRAVARLEDRIRELEYQNNELQFDLDKKQREVDDMSRDLRDTQDQADRYRREAEEARYRTNSGGHW